MNFKLKGELVARFGSQCAASRALEISEWKLSRLIRGWDLPTESELQTFERVLGQKTAHGIFDKSGAVQRDQQQ